MADAVRGGEWGALTMMKHVRTGVAALAFIGLVAQPIAADAHCCWPCPTNGGGIPNWGVAWVFGFFLCGGMAIGQQDEWAKKHHTQVTGRDRAGAFVACILPPIGLAQLDKHQHV
jgi:hypothetical protein